MSRDDYYNTMLTDICDTPDEFVEEEVNEFFDNLEDKDRLIFNMKKTGRTVPYFSDNLEDKDMLIFNMKKTGRTVPYFSGIGWRNIDFGDCSIVVSKDGSYAGFCGNNKWYLNERKLTEDEIYKIMSILEEASIFYYDGELKKARQVLRKLWMVFNSFDFPTECPWF